MSTDEKLDTILQRLDGLSTDMRKLQGEMSGVQSEVATMKQTVQDIEATVDSKLEAFKQSINNNIASELEKAKTDLRNIIKTEVEQSVDVKLENVDIGDLIKKQHEMQQQLDELRSFVDRPFHPDRSVVVYGFTKKEDETIDEQVNRLLYEILEVTCTPKFYERVESRSTDNQGC